MSELKVGDRVRVYSGQDVFRGKILKIFKDGTFEISVAGIPGIHSAYYHPKQCRKLVKKKKASCAPCSSGIARDKGFHTCPAPIVTEQWRETADKKAQSVNTRTLWQRVLQRQDQTRHIALSQVYEDREQALAGGAFEGSYELIGLFPIEVQVVEREK